MSGNKYRGGYLNGEKRRSGNRKQKRGQKERGEDREKGFRGIIYAKRDKVCSIVILYGH